MPPRNHKKWLATPKIEYISSECYNNYEVYEQELEHIFSKVWIPICHKSEMPNKGDFRSTQIAFKNVIAVNNGDSFKAYLCPSANRPSGNGISVEGLTELPSGVQHGGMVWTTLNPNPLQSIDEWTAGAFDCIADAIDAEEMEVFAVTS